jgi:hypothetical protein
MIAIDHYRDKATGRANYATQSDLADEQALPAAASASCGFSDTLDDRTDEGIALRPDDRLAAGCPGRPDGMSCRPARALLSAG